MDSTSSETAAAANVGASSRSDSTKFPSLNGIRALLCVWMLAFHASFWMSYFLTESEARQLADPPIMKWVLLGYFPVDGFFVLTGFLLAHPFFESHRRHEQDGRQSPTFSLRLFYFRRLFRMVPVYFLFLFLICCFLFYLNGAIPSHLVRHNVLREMFHNNLPEKWPTGCENGGFIFNLFFVNNLLPFGGCQGHTWSLAIQFQFYLWFPIILYFSNSTRTVVKISILLVVLSVLFRVLAYFHILHFYTLEKNSTFAPIPGFIIFFYYSNTFTRIGVIFLGVIASWITTHRPEWIQWLKSPSTFMVRLFGCLLSLCIMYLQASWNYSFAGSPYSPIQAPGGPAFQLLAQDEYRTWPRLILHFIYYVFVSVGSPLSGATFCYLVLCVVHSIGAFGKQLNKALSWQPWSTVADLSYHAYLYHPQLFPKVFFHTLPEPTPLGYTKAFLSGSSVVFFVSWLLYGKPLDEKTRQKEIPWLVNLVYRCGLILLVCAVVAHVIIHWKIWACWTVECFDGDRGGKEEMIV